MDAPLLADDNTITPMDATIMATRTSSKNPDRVCHGGSARILWPYTISLATSSGTVDTSSYRHATSTSTTIECNQSTNSIYNLDGSWWLASFKLDTTPTTSLITPSTGECNVSNTITPTFNTPSRWPSSRFGTTSQLSPRGPLHWSPSRLWTINKILSYKGLLFWSPVFPSKSEALHLLLSSWGITRIPAWREIQ